MGNISYTIRPMYKYMVTEILLCGLGSLCLSDTYFFPRPSSENITPYIRYRDPVVWPWFSVSERHLLFSKAELREHHALYTLHKIPRDRASPSGPPNMIT